jgi:hypothetical protein
MQLKWLTGDPTEFSFARESAMALRSKHKVSRLVLAAFAMTTAWLAAGCAYADADDVLGGSASFHIAASPLAGALIEFSTQSGIQVAAADADVAHLNSNDVNGTMPIGAALSTLLAGTGLEFSRVGAETVAIHGASIARASNANPAANAAPSFADSLVTAPPPPSNQELAGDSVYQFIVHHATTHFADIPTARDLARWRGGRQSICPLTVGLSPADNAFVTARIRALAAYVGAPVQSDQQCKASVKIIFTDNPKASMDEVVKWATVYFRNRYRGGVKDLIEFKSDHAIQGFYMTTRGGSIVISSDAALVGLDVLPLWPEITQKYAGTPGTGTLMDGGGGGGSGIGVVILVVDAPKVATRTLGTIADYLGMLTLSVAQSPDHCDPLPSILDLMSSCATREAPTAITAGDIAFLKALYYLNTGLGPSMSRAAIRDNMMQQFGHR